MAEEVMRDLTLGIDMSIVICDTLHKPKVVDQFSARPLRMVDYIYC
jgi:hypothetical protein